MTFKIHPRTRSNGLDDFRFACKSMANLISLKRTVPPGKPGMRSITNKILDGSVTLCEVQSWYPRAVAILRKGEV